MGERSINTILRLKNESEYRAALKGCNQELKNLKSHLDLVSSEFRNNANSMEALTAKGKVLDEMYTAQTKKISTLRGALEQAEQTREREQKTLSELRSQYEEAKKTLDAYGDEVDESSEDYQKAKAEVDKLANSIYAHQVKLNASQVSIDKYSTQLNRATIELNDMKDRQDENNRLLAETKTSADGCAASIDRYGDAVRDAADGTGQSVSSVEALASALVASGVQQKVEDLAATMMECSEASQTFELAMAKVYTIADESVLSRADMSAGIMQIAADLRKDADELADAAYEALSAGVSTANVLDFVRQSTQLSVAGFTDAANAVDVLTTILNSYGLEASQTEAIASKLVKTQDLGKISVDELGKVMGRVIPSAAAYGVNLDNIAAAYANMTASGINAENTTTYLSAMLDELADSGSDVAGILKNETGMSFAELMGSGKSLGDVLGILQQNVGGNSTAFSNLWSSATAGRGALALINGGVDGFNRTLGEMATATGAVAANYEKMANTSDYASRRVSTATQNLKIAVGDQLNPVLNQLRNAGADIMDEAADIVAQNPTLMASITGIVTAVGLLSAGMTGLAIVKTITPLFAAFNAVLAANPVAIVAIGVVSLGAAIATFAAQCKNANADLEALTEASRNLSDIVSAGNQSYLDTATSANAAYETVGEYVKRLEELEAQGVETYEQQVEYAMILDQINATIPELNASIDEQTGLIKGGTDALMEQAEQWKRTAIQEAAYTRYKADIKALADAQYEATKNQIMLDDARKRSETITLYLTSAQEGLTHWTNELNGATLREGETFEQFNVRCQNLHDTVSVYADKVVELQVAQRDTAREITNYEEAVRIANETMAQQQPLVDAATKAVEQYGEQIVVTGENVEVGTAEYAQNATDNLDQISEEYQKLRDAARDSLETQFGLFEEAKIKTDLSARDMIRNLQSQRDAFNNYADNIALAMERGIDMGLVQKLSDGTAESMAQLAVLVTATEKEIAEINAAWLELEGGKDNAETAISTVEGTILGLIEQMKPNLYEAAFGAGANTGDGLIAGLRSKTSGYTNEVTALANAGIKAYISHNRIASPSKRWAELAEWDVAGISTTYKKSIPKIEAQSTELANSGYSAAIRARQRSLSSMSSVTTQRPSAGIGAEIVPLLKQLLSAVKEGKILAVNGRSMVAATADEYDTQMGQRRFLVERGAK